MKLTREEIHHVKESIKCGKFASEWWKHLSKLIKSCDLTTFEKSSVFTQIICGLIKEIDNTKDLDSRKYAFNTIYDEIFEKLSEVNQ